MAKKPGRNSSNHLGDGCGVDVLAPTAERFTHGVVEQFEKPIADDDGRPARPYRHIDVLGVMERRGSISATMRGAGEQFRCDFTRAHLEPLRAGDMVRVSRGSRADPALTSHNGRKAVWRAVCAVGGLASPAGSCLWGVIGLESTLKAWALTQGWAGRLVSQEAASGILIAALGMLEAHYDGRRHS